MSRLDCLSAVHSLALCAALGLVAAPALAQDDAASTPAGASSIQQQMDAMRRELERVQKDNQSMQGEIDQLRSDADDQWLTEKRAQEIKGLVQDVLADADTRASLLDSGMTAGWDEHFFLSSADGRFLLMFEGLQQIRFIYNYRSNADQSRYGFENTRTELTLRGHVFSDAIEYKIRGDYSRSGGGDVLREAWVRYNFGNKLSVRFGQFKLPFNREFLIGDGYQQAVERSLVSELFSVGYSQGVELEYLDNTNRLTVAFSDGASSSIAGTNTANTVWSAQDTEWAVSGRYELLLAGDWNQFKQFTSRPGDEFGMLLGFGASVQQGESTGLPTNGRDETRFFDSTVDLSMDWGGANLFLSAYYAYLDTARNNPSSPGGNFNLFGFTIQGGVYIAPKWELFARGEYIVFSSNAPTLPNFGAVTAGVNYYLDGQDLKWTTDISFQIDEASFTPDITGFRPPEGSGTQIVLRTQFQLMF